MDLQSIALPLCYDNFLCSECGARTRALWLMRPAKYHFSNSQFFISSLKQKTPNISVGVLSFLWLEFLFQNFRSPRQIPIFIATKEYNPSRGTHDGWYFIPLGYCFRFHSANVKRFFDLSPSWWQIFLILFFQPYNVVWYNDGSQIFSLC